MLSPIIYYLACSGLIVIGGTGAFYLYDRDLAQETFFNVSWELTKQYHNARHQFNEWEMVINNFLNEDKESNVNGIEMNDIKCEFGIMGYNKKEDTTFTMESDKIDFLKDITFDLLWLTCVKKGEKYFIRLDNKIENNNLDEIKKLFDTKMDKMLLQIELEQNGETLEIHKYLKEHYYEGNKILDRDFLLWYMHYNNLGELSDGYQLKVIDSNVEMFTMQPNQYIMLTADGYECVTDEQ